MSKTKKKNRHVAEKKLQATKEKKANPFEMKINKQKNAVLGKSIRGQFGHPTQTKAKAQKRRSDTLLKELGKIQKKNVFKDTRLSETQRLTLERKNQHRRVTAEGEEAELTHLGQSVSEIEKFNDPELDSDSDEDGRLGGRVAEEHFGGFLARKSETEKVNWKEKMADLIAQTKKRKYEQQNEKDSLQKKREEVDEEFKSLAHLLITKKPAAEKEKKKSDDYDIKVRSLQFEMKGMPSDRLKTEEELAKEEAERLKKLEADRKRRMKGEVVAPTHISADSLDDGYSFVHQKEDGDDGDSSDGDNDEDDDDNDEEDDDDDSDDDDDDDDDDDGEQDESEEEKEEKEEEEKEDAKIEALQQKEKKTEETVDQKEQEEVIEAATKEIPYTFKAPEDMEDLESLLKSYGEDDQVTVVERLVACHHPSLAEGNKQKLLLLFSLLLQHLTQEMMTEDPPVKLFNRLMPLLQRLLHYNPEVASATVSQLLNDRHDMFEKHCKRHGRRGVFIGLDTMLLLKLVGVLYSTSDFKHPVVTPAFYLISTMLYRTPVRTYRDVAAGLYLCALCSEYISQSKRYIPEVINFLHGILFLAAKKEPEKVEKVFLPFKPVGEFVDLLQVKHKVNDVAVLSIKKTLATSTEEQLNTDEFRISAISTCVKLLQEYIHLYSELPSAPEIFQPVHYMLNKLPVHLYPQGLQECIALLNNTFERDPRPRACLALEKKKVQPLKLFEPKIDETFDGRKKRKGSREQLERQRLQYKVRKERKAAVREIRKDSQFLAREKLKATLKKDADRQNKLKRLYSDLSTQEGDYKALKRKKDH